MGSGNGKGDSCDLGEAAQIIWGAGRACVFQPSSSCVEASHFGKIGEQAMAPNLSRPMREGENEPASTRILSSQNLGGGGFRGRKIPAPPKRWKKTARGGVCLNLIYAAPPEGARWKLCVPSSIRRLNGVGLMAWNLVMGLAAA